MGIYWLAVANSMIIELSTRVVCLASLSLFILFAIYYWLHKNELIKQYLFLLITAVILFASTVLFTTALLTIQGRV